VISPNDWKINKCLILSGGLLVAMLGLVWLAVLGFDIPILRQIVGFLLLTFIPGILLLRIFKIHNINTVESLLYSAGLSITFNMVVGLVTNFALPPLGISHPFKLIPLTIVFTIFNIILPLIAYWRDKDFQPTIPDTTPVMSTNRGFWANLNPYLLAILLPLLAILGTRLMNAYQNNIILIILLLIIVLITGLVALNKFIPPSVYPLMIFTMAIALLYQTTLYSVNLIGSDIHLEYYHSASVLENSYWDASVYSLVNSCLSISMLAPVYSLILNMDIIWLFKIVYPLIFTLLPLALFRIFRLQFGPRRAFIATTFFISMPMFTMDMVQLNRQQISELFFVLIILLLVDRRLTLIIRTALVITFGFGVIVSYYGLGTGYMGYLIFGTLVLIFIKSRIGQTIWQWIVGKHSLLPTDLTAPGAFNKRTLAITIVISLIFMLAYYNTVASGIAMFAPSTAIEIAHQATIAPQTTGPEFEGFQFLNQTTKEPLTQTALGLDFGLASIGGKIWRIFQYIVELFLIIGFIRLIFRPSALGSKLKAEYIALTIVSTIILLGVFTLPTQSYGLGTSRVWQITLLLISPLFILCGETIALGILQLVRLFRKNFASPILNHTNLNLMWLPIIIILIPYFVFNSGIVFELSKSQTTHFIDMPYSIALSNYRIDVSTGFTRQDVTAADWLFKNPNENYTMVADYNGCKIFWQHGYAFQPHETKLFTYKSDEIPYPSYIYLRTWNNQKKSLTMGTAYAARQQVNFTDIPGLVQIIDSANIIYDNNGSSILLPNESKDGM